MDTPAGNQPQPPPPPPPQTPQIVYLQPGQQAVYVQPGQEAPHVAPTTAQLAGQWAYPQAYISPEKQQPSSGLRVSAGILGIALGAWNLVMFFAMMVNSYGPSTPLVGWLNFLHLVGTLAVLTLGIMIIAKHRRRSKPIPAMLLGGTLGLIVVDIAAADANWLPGLATLTLAGGLPTAVLAALVLFKESGITGRK